MKKFICVILASVFMLNATAFAADTDVLKLDEAIKRAVEGSTKLQIDDLNVSNSQKLYNSAVKDSENFYVNLLSKNYLKDHESEISEYISDRTKDEITPVQTENDYDYSKKARQIDENALVLDVYNTYYQLVKLNRDIELNTKELTIKKTSQADSYNKYKKGLISKNDYKLIQINTKNFEMKLNSLKRNKKKSILKLYNLMNQGYNPDIKPLDDKLEYTLLEVNIEDVIKNALENRADLFKLEKDYEVKELEYNLMKEIYDEDDLEYIDAQNNFEESKLSIESKKQDIEYEIRSSYNDILSMYDNIDIAKKDLEKAKIAYEEAQLKTKLGMMTKTEVQTAQLEYFKLKHQVDCSIIDYILAVKKFELVQGVRYAE